MLLFLLILVALQRLWELQIAQSNVAHLRHRGAVEFGAEHYPFMVGLHTFWFFSTLFEWWNGVDSLPAGLVAGGWVMLLAGQSLRWWTIRTLGRRWTTRVLILPDAPLVESGPFRYFTHPNYLGVVLEMFGLPLIGGCWKTSLIFGSLNLVLLFFRVRLENQALRGEL